LSLVGGWRFLYLSMLMCVVPLPLQIQRIHLLWRLSFKRVRFDTHVRLLNALLLATYLPVCFIPLLFLYACIKNVLTTACISCILLARPRESPLVQEHFPPLFNLSLSLVRYHNKATPLGEAVGRQVCADTNTRTQTCSRTYTHTHTHTHTP
jgi:hypothetical protein